LSSLIVLTLALAAGGCGGDSDPTSDAGQNGGQDAGWDSGADVGSDTVDAGGGNAGSPAAGSGGAGGSWTGVGADASVTDVSQTGDVPFVPPPVPTDASAGPGNPDLLGPPPFPRPDGGIVVRPPNPPPAINPSAMKVLPAGSIVLGGITVACSQGPGTTASGGRWCAFARPGQTLSTLELWVMNTSRLPARCDGTSADCIKLSSNLYGGVPQGGGPQFPSAHRFYGDLLIFHADAVSRPSDTYSGPIYAWQPGWPAARKISATNNAFRCVGITQAPVALCIENVKFDATPLTFDLMAGRVDGGKPVQKLAEIDPAHPTTMASQWAATFSTDGKYFAYSVAPRPIPPAIFQTPETLFVIETDKIGLELPKMVGEPGISGWQIAPDFSKWFYLRDYNYSQTLPSGTLWAADFPGGANPIKLTSTRLSGGSNIGVAAFGLVPTPGPVPTLAFVNVLHKQGVDGLGELLSIKNPAGSLEDPANVTTLLAATSSLPVNSPDLRFGRYFSAASSSIPGLTDSRILKYDQSPPCTLTASPTSVVFGAPFLDHAGLTFWTDNYDQNSDTGDGMLASPVDCAAKKRKFATAIDYWFVKGDDQLLYSDDVRGDVSTLRLSKIVGGDLAAPQVLQNQIERKGWAILPNQEAVLYEIRSGDSTVDGIYFLKLP
jgi:hypothetical protein